MEDKVEEEKVELLDARKELELLEDNQLLNVFYNALARCEKEDSVVAKNIFMLSMEMCIDKKLLGDMNYEDKDKLLAIADKVV